MESISLASNPAGEVEVLGHDGDPLGVDGTQIGVLEEAHEVGLGSLLKSEHGLALESDVLLELDGDLSDEPLEGQLPDKQIRLKY
jgi:hypothetical protein